MKNQQPLGLVVEGNATSSAVLKLRSLTEDLGPIKAGSLRVARRLSNYLRAGYAVNNYEDLQNARLILLRIPDAAIPRIVDDLCASELVWKGVAVVLCESYKAANALISLEKLGACTATLMQVQSLRRSWFVIEGESTAVRQLKRFLQRNDAGIFELRPGAKPLYFAAQLLATALPAQLLTTAQQTLRAAGISGNHLYDLLEEMCLEMFRSFANGVRYTFPGGRTGCSPDIWNEYLEYLRAQYPHLAAGLDEQVAWAIRQQAPS
jgi:predicted short-subunit dehydrogenase-like oxidoreductase (DUF2520 family)